jgi:hypothetical protein
MICVHYLARGRGEGASIALLELSLVTFELWLLLQVIVAGVRSLARESKTL